MEHKQIELEVIRNGYCIIPNFIDEISAKEIRNEYFQILQTKSLHSQSESFNFEDLKKKSLAKNCCWFK